MQRSEPRRPDRARLRSIGPENRSRRRQVDAPPGRGRCQTWPLTSEPSSEVPLRDGRRRRPPPDALVRPSGGEGSDASKKDNWGGRGRDGRPAGLRRHGGGEGCERYGPASDRATHAGGLARPDPLARRAGDRAPALVGVVSPDISTEDPSTPAIREPAVGEPAIRDPEIPGPEPEPAASARLATPSPGGISPWLLSGPPMGAGRGSARPTDVRHGRTREQTTVIRE